MKVNRNEIPDLIRRYGAVAVLLLLVVGNCLFTPNFFHVNTLWNILMQAFSTIIISMGMTIVIATGGIDISVGSTMALSSIVFARMLIVNEAGFGISIFLALLAAAAFGLFNGILIGVFDFQPIVATLILMISGRGIAQQFNGGAVISFYGNRYAELGTYRIGGVLPIQVLVIAVILAGTLFLVNKTVFGRFVQAIGDNKKASSLMGINTAVILIGSYMLCALLAGGAAVLETLRICSADPNNIGNAIELDCIAAVAIGGTSMNGGKAVVLGTLTGALVMQIITTMMNMNNIFYAYALVVKSAIIVVALYLQREKKQ